MDTAQRPWNTSCLVEDDVGNIYTLLDSYGEACRVRNIVTKVDYVFSASKLRSVSFSRDGEKRLTDLNNEGATYFSIADACSRSMQRDQITEALIEDGADEKEVLQAIQHALDRAITNWFLGTWGSSEEGARTALIRIALLSHRLHSALEYFDKEK